VFFFVPSGKFCKSLSDLEKPSLLVWGKEFGKYFFFPFPTSSDIPSKFPGGREAGPPLPVMIRQMKWGEIFLFFPSLSPDCQRVRPAIERDSPPPFPDFQGTG